MDYAEGFEAGFESLQVQIDDCLTRTIKGLQAGEYLSEASVVEVLRNIISQMTPRLEPTGLHGRGA